MIGAVKHLEIWDAAAWEQYLAEHEEEFSEARDEALHDIL